MNQQDSEFSEEAAEVWKLQGEGTGSRRGSINKRKASDMDQSGSMAMKMSRNAWPGL